VLYERPNELLVRLQRGAQAPRHVLDPVVTIGVPPLVPTVEQSPVPPTNIEHRRATARVGQWTSLAPQLLERSSPLCASRRPRMEHYGRTPTPSATTESGATLVEDVPTATPTPPPTSDPTDDLGNDILFLALVRANAPKLEQAPDASVIELGKGVCEAYDECGTTTDRREHRAVGSHDDPADGLLRRGHDLLVLPGAQREEVAGIDAAPNFMGCSTHSSAATSRPEG